MESLVDALASVIRQRYDQCPPGKWPMEDSLAEFILEVGPSAGLAIGVTGSEWNDAIDALMDRFDSAISTLEEMSEAKRGQHSDYDRLRGKVMGMRLALDFARGMRLA